eukprot:3914383-Lingulodinium_polyedra.AAC.1
MRIRTGCRCRNGGDGDDDDDDEAAGDDELLPTNNFTITNHPSVASSLNLNRVSNECISCVL